MDLTSKFRETVVSVLPVMGIVLLLGLFAIPAESAPPHWLHRFLIGGVLLVFGLTLFLLGVDMGIQPLGERCGAALTRRRSLALLLGAALAMGLIVTVAEPCVQVFADQVIGIFPAVSKPPFTLAIAAGVGLFMMLGMLRSVLGLSLKWMLFACYTALFLLSLWSPAPFIGVAFDAGGATTGPMTVPFIMALGLGVSSVRAQSGDSFGLTGIASVGPVAAPLLYALAIGVGTLTTSAAPAPEAAAAAAPAATSLLAPFLASLGPSFHEAFSSIAPLFLMLIAAQFLLLRMTGRQFSRLVVGFIYAFIGLGIFLLGANGGFADAGHLLGEALGQLAARGPFHYVLLLATGLIFGAIIVCAEPAVWVLTEQVEQVSGGAIPRRTLLLFLALSTAFAVAFAVLRAIEGFPLWYLLLPLYALAMLLMPFAPDPFAGIAFDSGGVASGPLTSTCLLSFTLGTASAGPAGAADPFGVIALVALMPLIAIQLMGIAYHLKRKTPAP